MYLLYVHMLIILLFDVDLVNGVVKLDHYLQMIDNKVNYLFHLVSASSGFNTTDMATSWYAPPSHVSVPSNTSSPMSNDSTPYYSGIGAISKDSTSVRLAKESFFGKEVMKLCTVCGTVSLHPLPVAELSQLKQYLVDKFVPRFTPTKNWVWKSMEKLYWIYRTGLQVPEKCSDYYVKTFSHEHCCYVDIIMYLLLLIMYHSSGT